MHALANLSPSNLTRFGFCGMPLTSPQQRPCQAARLALHSKKLRKSLTSTKCPAQPGEQNVSSAQQAIQERIRRAKEYRTTKEVTPPPPTAGTSIQDPPPSDTSGFTREGGAAAADEFNRNLATFGEKVAERQQDVFAAALKDAQTKSEDHVAVEDKEVARQRELQQRQRQKDMLAQKAARIDSSLHSKVRSGGETAKPDTFSRARSEGAEASQLDGLGEQERRRQAAVSGSSEEAAVYLQRVAQGQSEAAGLRPEQFTILKEEETKARGVEFITRDGNYDPLRREREAAAEEAYNPKVSTWGVFARPSNISKAFGGGKTIRPGEALETQEKTKERDARVAAAILDYRKKQGLFVDPEEEAKWTAAYTGGVDLMQAGQLQAAAVRFDEVIQAIPARSKLGGEAQLQKAICLDSAGQNDEAYKLYLALERHPQPDVQKRAKRMLFGFRAAENLKAHTMSYSVGAKGNKDWEKYFTKLTGEWNSGYVDDGEVDNISTVVATAVILVPLAVAGLLILT